MKPLSRTVSLLPLLAIGLSTVAYSASFECDNASTWVETRICRNPELSKLDEQLAQQYKAEIKQAKDNDAKDSTYNYVKRERDNQIKWLVFRRNTCRDEACLLREYQERLSGKASLFTATAHERDKNATLPKASAFGDFVKNNQIAMYNLQGKNKYEIVDHTSKLAIYSVVHKPNLAVIDTAMVFDNGHMCTISDKLATWSQNHWVLPRYKSDLEITQIAELRLYPTLYQGKPQILINDIDDQYRKNNCGMRGYLDGLTFRQP